MILTTRFAIAFAAGALMIGFSGRFAPLAWAGLAAASLAVVLAVGDWLETRRGAALEVSRTCDEKLSLGADNPVRLRLRNPTRARIGGVIRDEYPEGFAAAGSEVPFRLEARSESEIIYHVTPPTRGDFEFGDAYLRLFGPFGMALRQIRYPAGRAVKVYPNLLDLRKYEIGLRRERPVLPGRRLVRAYGRGTEFESLREYLPDDEFRSVDWKATARRGALVVRQYQHERAQNIVLALDCGRTMGPAVDGLTRLDHSINASMMLANVAAIRGDKVGMIAFGEDVISYSPPRAGRGQTLSLLQLAYNLREAVGDSNYQRALNYLAGRWTRRSLVVVFTDVTDPVSSGPLIEQIAALAKKHLCVAVLPSDTDVLQAARGLSGGLEDAYRAAAARQALQAREAAKADLARAGAIVLDVPPAGLTAALVDGYLDIKARARL